MALPGVLLSCYSPPLYSPAWPKTVPRREPTPKVSPGLLPLSSEAVAIRSKLVEELPTVPLSRIQAIPKDAIYSCLWMRLGPGASFQREVTLALSSAAKREPYYGFRINLRFISGMDGEERTSMDLWYDFRGRLISTVTLPSLPHGSEEAGTREEFFVFTYLPNTQEWVAEGQRLVGPSPKEPWSPLPHALLVDARDPYHASYRASAYMVCKEPSKPNPLP